MRDWQRITTIRPNDTLVPLSARLFLLLLGAVSPACSAEGRARAASAPPMIPTRPAAVSDESFDPRAYRSFQSERPAPLEPVFEPSSPAVCRWTASFWSGPLRVAADLEPFATVESAYAVTVAIPEGDAPQGARLSAEVLGVRFNAFVAASDLELHLKRGRLLAGFVWAGPGSVLRWTRAGGGRVAYQLVVPPQVSPTAGPPTGEQACQELSVESGDEGLPRALFGDRRSVLQRRWRGDARIPLARAPGQPPLAFLDTRPTCTSDEPEVECEVPEPDEVFVLEKRADWLRIVYVLETITVEGWVPEAAVQKPFERVETADLLLAGTPWGPVELFGANDPTLALADDSAALCAWNAPLAVETSGVARNIGSIASGIPLLPGVQRQGWREVTLAHHPALTFAAAARAWVPERLLYPCRP